MSTTAAGSATLDGASGVASVDVLELPLLPTPAGRIRRALTRRMVFGLLAIATLGTSFALVQQDPGPTPVSHVALVTSLAAGTAVIGPGVTIDTAYIKGKYYANKAPGLAFSLLPAYLGLRELGLQKAGPSAERGYERRLWELTLFGAVLPAVVLMLLMLAAVEHVRPGFGALTATLLGAGTLLLPFATLLFGHMLSATLGFAAFLVLLLERERGPSVRRTFAAGLLAGFAVVVEYPLAIVALVLAAYVASTAPVARRLGGYLAGCALGVLPLLAYDTWAFGSPTTLSYTNVLNAPVGTSGASPVLGGGNSTGFYGVALPDFRAALTLLFSEKGLFVVTPLCLVALLGLPALWRSGRRAETLVCGAVPALFLAYNASYYLPFGGQGPGPRFLVPALPFLALPLSAMLARRLLPVLVLGLVSVGVMALATATAPLVTGADHALGDWVRMLAHGELMETPLPLHGRAALLPAALLLLLAVGLAVASLGPGRDDLRPGPIDLLIIPAWLVTALAVPRLLPADASHGTRTGTLAAVCVVAGIAAGLACVRRRGAVVAAALAPLLVLVLPAVYARQRLALLVALATLGLVVGVARTKPRAPV